MQRWGTGEEGGEEVDGKWMKHVERWKKQGRPGGVPPGVHGVGVVGRADGEEAEEERPREAGDREYSSRNGKYMLRPEVSCSFLLCVLAVCAYRSS